MCGLFLERENEDPGFANVSRPTVPNKPHNGAKPSESQSITSQSRQKTQMALDSMSQDLFQTQIEPTPKSSSQKKRKFGELTPAKEITNISQNYPVIGNDFTVEGVNDIFGDIDDILLEEQLYKRPKVDQKKRDLAIIDKIIELRRLYREQYTTSLRISRNNSDGKGKKRNKDMANIAAYIPRWPFLPVAKSTGQTLYVRFHSETYMEEEIDMVASKNDFKGKVITKLMSKTCFNPIFAGFIGNTYQPIWEEAHKIIGRMYAENEPQPEPEIAPFIDESTQLWVETYKPKKYVELLSDERTNRTLLHWVKLWDKVVFNRHPPNITQIKSKFENKWNERFDIEFKLEADGRPHHKVALLCGPPGLGKTTLGHMIAKHAGYNVVEINASDDRSIEAFRNVLENATQMKSIVDRENRPNCIILDEIDGAPKASIEFLIKFISGAHKEKKGKAAKGLKRPVLCICNDVYAPALRNLRKIAFVVHFPPTASGRLSTRLMEIAKFQHVKTDIGALLALCEKTHNDIRACLSVLHFFKTQNKTVSIVYRKVQETIRKVME